MKITEAIKEIVRHPILCFDRSFSERGTRQLWWLLGAVIAMFLILLGISFCVSFEEINEDGKVMGHLLRMVTLFIDPGAIGYLKESSRIFGIVVALCGLVMMTGMFISVLTNMLDVRVEKVRGGKTHYHLEGHVVIIGMDDLVPSLIKQICNSEKFGNAYILVQSTMEADDARSRIHNVLDKNMESRIVIYRGKRNSREDLLKLNITKAQTVFITGDCGDQDRDSLNLDAMRMIAEICETDGNRTEKDPLPVAVQFEYQTTFAAFQVTDLAERWRKYIDFYPFNFYESWAKKLFVSRYYTHDNTKMEYPRLDREPITYDSEKTVHLIILGMSSMGVAMGTFAAHLLHFPNFCRDHTKKSRITFIDANADREMDFFRNRYRGIFEISSSLYRDYTKDEMEEKVLPPTYFKGDDANFLDIEFEFFKGYAESTAIQEYLRDAAKEENTLTTVVVCLKESSMNMVVGLSLPNEIYDKKIPVFIRLKSSEALLTMLNKSGNSNRYSKYSHLYPFGMLEEYYDLDYDKLELAQWINVYYEKEDPVTKKKPTPQSAWRKLSVALQWSNFYCAYSKDFKIRSFEIPRGKVPSEAETKRLCMVEHNRWCLEKLLLGYRKPNKEEQEKIDCGGIIMENGKEKGIAQWYKDRFVHNDLVPCEQMTKEALLHSKDVIIGILK